MFTNGSTATDLSLTMRGILPVTAVERNVDAEPPEAAVSEHGPSVGALSVDAAAVVRVSTHGSTGAIKR